MKKLSVVFLAICLTAALAAAAEEGTPAPVAQENKGESNLMFGLGFGYPFLDLNQFQEDLDDLDLPDFSWPLAACFSISAEWGKSPHFLQLNAASTVIGVRANANGRYAEVIYDYNQIGLGYHYQALPWLGFHANVPFTLGFWRYELISPHFNGLARGDDYGLNHRAGIYFDIDRSMGFDLYGGYQFRLGRGAELYSGDMEREDFNDFDFDHALIGLDFIFHYVPRK